MNHGRRIFALVAISTCAIQIGCAAAPANTIRICDGSGCSMRDRTAQAIPAAATTASGAREPSVDVYRGEDLALLESQAATGDGGAEHKLGLASYYGLGGRSRNPAQAAAHFERAADLGIPAAQYRLARLCRTGEGTKRDSTRALRLLHAAAQQAFGPAAYELGAIYLHGDGVPPDQGEGFRWSLVAAESGVDEAQYDVALMYYRGEGVRHDPYEALQWFRTAAESGSLPAQSTLGRIYFQGFDTMGQDLVESERWLRVAADRGDADARRLLAAVERTRSDEAEQERELLLWREKSSVYLAALRYTYSYWSATYWATSYFTPARYYYWVY